MKIIVFSNLIFCVTKHNFLIFQKLYTRLEDVSLDLLGIVLIFFNLVHSFRFQSECFKKSLLRKYLCLRFSMLSIN